jgi:hypothetical protein
MAGSVGNLENFQQVDVDETMQKPFPRGFFMTFDSKTVARTQAKEHAPERALELWPCLIFPDFFTMNTELEQHHAKHPPPPAGGDCGFTREVRCKIADQVWCSKMKPKNVSGWDFKMEQFALLVGLNIIVTPIDPLRLRRIYDRAALQVCKTEMGNKNFKHALGSFARMLKLGTKNTNLLGSRPRSLQCCPNGKRKRKEVGTHSMWSGSKASCAWPGENKTLKTTDMTRVTKEPHLIVSE